MTKPHLETLKRITTWGGALVTLAGITLGVVTGGSRAGASVALFGLLLTCCGHWVGVALAHHQAAEKAADQERIAELAARVDYAEELLDNPDFKRAIRKEADRYAIEHQDDGR